MAELIIEQLVTDTATGESVWTPYVFTFSAETDFLIDTENLDGEICGMGPLLNQYGEAHSKLQAQLERHKRELEQVSSALYILYRAKLLKEGEKATEGIIKAHITVADEYQVATAKYVETMKHATRAEGWWKAVLKKADLTQALAYKLSSEIKRGAY
jgi:hypothetical protein